MLINDIKFNLEDKTIQILNEKYDISFRQNPIFKSEIEVRITKSKKHNNFIVNVFSDDKPPFFMKNCLLTHISDEKFLNDFDVEELIKISIINEYNSYIHNNKINEKLKKYL